MTFSQRIGHTNYDVHVYCDPNETATYEDRLLALIRSHFAIMDEPYLPNAPQENAGAA